jgi:hypothetical protein
MGTYRPRRASQRWLEGAPSYVLDVLDEKNHGERYTVLFCEHLLFHTARDGGIKSGPDERSNTYVQYLGMDDSPTHPQGISMWGEMTAHEAATYRYVKKNSRIRWADLPQRIQEHVIARAKPEPEDGEDSGGDSVKPDRQRG